MKVHAGGSIGLGHTAVCASSLFSALSSVIQVYGLAWLPKLATAHSLLLALLLGWTGAALGAGPVLNYTGRISQDGVNFTGDGYFVFAIHDISGEILWSSGDFPQAGGTNHPPATCRIAMRDGVYQTRLGDTNAGMPALDAARLNAAKNPFLRVWFLDGSGRGWQIASDIPLKPMLAETSPPAPSVAADSNSGAQTEAVLSELREVKLALQKIQQAIAAKPAAPEQPRIVTVGLGDSPSLGHADAPAVLVEFTDFQCPFCKTAHDDLLAKVQKKYVDTGKLRLVSRSLPLPFHPNAEPAAQAALCAGEQGQFWAMRDRLFSTPATLSGPTYLQLAEELKLDGKAFAACLEAKKFTAQIERDKQDAAAAGINGTPTFVLGRAVGTNVTGLLMVGAKPLAVFDAEMEKILSTK